MFAVTVKTSEIVANLRNVIDITDLFVSLFQSNIFRIFIYQNKNKFLLVYLFILPYRAIKISGQIFKKNFRVNARSLDTEYLRDVYIRQIIFSI